MDVLLGNQGMGAAIDGTQAIESWREG